MNEKHLKVKNHLSILLHFLNPFYPTLFTLLYSFFLSPSFYLYYFLLLYSPLLFPVLHFLLLFTFFRFLLLYPNFRLFKRVHAFPQICEVRCLQFRDFTLNLMRLSLSA